MSRVLVFCMTFLRNPYDGKLLRIWQEMLEPQGYDLLIVESRSPHILPRYLMPDWEDWQHWEISDDDALMTVSGRRNVLYFKDSRGHPFTTASERAPVQTGQ